MLLFVFKCIVLSVLSTYQSKIYFACILEQPEDDLGFKSRLLVLGGHVGRHIGFLGSPSFLPIYAGSFRNYRERGTFWYMTHLVVQGGGGGGSGFTIFQP